MIETAEMINASLAAAGVNGGVSYRRNGAGKGWWFHDNVTRRVTTIIDPRGRTPAQIVAMVAEKVAAEDRLRADAILRDVAASAEMIGTHSAETMLRDLASMARKELARRSV